MELPRSQKGVLEQVDQFWSMLDEMSQNNPGAYRTFMERQLRDGAQYLCPARPHTCLRTSVQPGEELLYVNVCAWKRVPAPSSRSQRVPVYGGRLQSVRGEHESYSVVEVAFNPEVLQMAEANAQEVEQIHLLALSFVRQQHNLNLSQHFTVTEDKLKGTAQDMKRRLTSPHLSECNTQNEPVPSLLQQICSRQTESVEDSITELSVGPGHHQAGPGLVQVISSTEAAQPPQPKHQVTVCPESGTSARTIRVRVKLPGVRGVSQCQLSVTQVDVLLEVEDMYYLHLQFPEAVDQDTCCATYNKRNHVLTVTVSVL
ncbi:PIH1 domain-containing protein 2 [Brachyhypopomus gauderio]|uniref:PIH1 domain-containing protein 2 n=1 Tax=Brachyhypopomus gauderio TaxID=698409 RepID=UPI0040412A90